MSYCLGIRVDEGLVLAADSRTNAGVDSVSTFRKLFVFERPGERVVVVLTAGNLAVTQEVIHRIERGLASDDPARNIILYGESMFDAARMVGDSLRAIYDRDADYFKAHGSEFNASLIVGGQVQGEPPRLFLIYPMGNFIEASKETPYFQLGETKYGKPILERVLTPGVPLIDAAKCALVSFDSTVKANISVGLPIDLVIYPRNTFRIATRLRVEEGDPYYNRLCNHWGEGLRRVFAEAPDPPWAAAGTPADRARSAAHG